MINKETHKREPQIELTKALKTYIFLTTTIEIWNKYVL
jgi:hypothetical protein